MFWHEGFTVATFVLFSHPNSAFGHCQLPHASALARNRRGCLDGSTKSRRLPRERRWVGCLSLKIWAAFRAESLAWWHPRGDPGGFWITPDGTAGAEVSCAP